jgi:hypothetical protein
MVVVETDAGVYRSILISLDIRVVNLVMLILISRTRELAKDIYLHLYIYIYIYNIESRP